MGKDKSNTANLLQAVAREGEKLQASERRNFLKQGLLLAGGALSGAAVPGTVLAGNNNLPPNVPSWTKSLGSGVLTNPYGKPSPYESHIVRRNVPWLTADRIASISFTPLAELRRVAWSSNATMQAFLRSILPSIDS